MSYNLSLPCGCVVYVSVNPDNGVAHTRVIETRSAMCPFRAHERGTRVYLWDLLPSVGPDAWSGRPMLAD